MIGWCSQNSGKELFTTEILWDSKKYNHAVLLNLWKLELLLFVFYSSISWNIHNTVCSCSCPWLYPLVGDTSNKRQIGKYSTRAWFNLSQFLSVWLNRLMNRLLANYLRNKNNDLATVHILAFNVAMLPNNSFICKYNIFSKYKLWQQFYKIDRENRKCKKPPASYPTGSIAHLLQSNFRNVFSSFTAPCFRSLLNIKIKTVIIICHVP